MTAKDAPFSFHCIICFFPFDLETRQPVVLPCGHTYICEPCSKRLKKCMECRTSLFIKPATNQNNGGVCMPSQASPSTPISPRNRSTYSIHRDRYNHYQTTPIKKPQPVELIPLPIPKNNVLIALMEAAERKKNALKDKNEDSDSEDYEDTQNVLYGIEALSSDSGTYAVRDNEGLPVFSQNPYGQTLRKVPSYVKPPPVIRYGQRVQVVGLENDVYKLARNKGYIIANKSQLVKGEMNKQYYMFSYYSSKLTHNDCFSRYAIRQSL